MTKVFACYNTNEKVRMKSSSGGFFFLIADKVISEGGIVYGACYEGTNVVHRRITNREGIEACCGSKYVPSVLKNTLKNVKEDLNAGKQVLFSGTPCQCNGLITYVGHNENLYVVDLVCHGVPSRKAWQAYLDSMRNHGHEIKMVNMRDKISGWSAYSWRLYESGGRDTTELYTQNPYMIGFLKDYYLRPSCYECRFRGTDRKTDVTLGDYWGVQDIQPEMFDDKGTSLVFVHTDKGMKMFQEVSKNLKYMEADLNQAVKRNPSVISSVKKPRQRQKFFKMMEKEKDFIYIIDKLTKPTLYKYMKKKLKSMLKQFVS